MTEDVPPKAKRRRPKPVIRFVCGRCQLDTGSLAATYDEANSAIGKVGWRILPRDRISDYALHCSQCAEHLAAAPVAEMA